MEYSVGTACDNPGCGVVRSRLPWLQGMRGRQYLPPHSRTGNRLARAEERMKTKRKCFLFNSVCFLLFFDRTGAVRGAGGREATKGNLGCAGVCSLCVEPSCPLFFSPGPSDARQRVPPCVGKRGGRMDHRLARPLRCHDISPMCQSNHSSLRHRHFPGPRLSTYRATALSPEVTREGKPAAMGS